MDEILNAYYADNARKLRILVDKMLLRFGGLSDRDKDDFYSLANEVFVSVMKKYDYKQPFDSFLYACLLRRIKAEMTKRNRYKRKTDRLSVSIYMPVGEDGETVVADLLVSDFDMDREIFDKENEHPKMERYLERLTRRQRKVVALLMDSYDADEIRRILCMTKKEYADAMAGIHAYENISVLFGSVL